MNIIRHFFIFILLSLLLLGMTGCNTKVIDNACGYANEFRITEDDNEYDLSIELLFNVNGTYEYSSYNNRYNDSNIYDTNVFTVDVFVNDCDNKYKYKWALSLVDFNDILYIYTLSNCYNNIKDILITNDNKAIINYNNEALELNYYEVPKISKHIFSINSIYTKTNFKTYDDLFIDTNNCFIYLTDHNKLYIRSAFFKNNYYEFVLDKNNIIINELDKNINITLYNNNKNIRIIYNIDNHSHIEEYELYPHHFTLYKFRFINF